MFLLYIFSVAPWCFVFSPLCPARRKGKTRQFAAFLCLLALTCILPGESRHCTNQLSTSDHTIKIKFNESKMISKCSFGEQNISTNTRHLTRTIIIKTPWNKLLHTHYNTTTILHTIFAVIQQFLKRRSPIMIWMHS